MLLQQLSRFSATTDQDGLFEIREPVAPDTWRVHLFERRRLLQETKLEVLTNESVKWIDLTAERARDVLSGVVVNDIGEPIADARVYFEMINGTHWYLVTGEDGTFRTPRFARDPTDPIKARATISGYTTPDPVSCEWGSSIEIVLTRGGMVDIHVTEAASGIPVLDYGVRIFRVPEHRSVPVNESLLRYFGTHDGGRFRVSGVLPGRSLVMVEPRGSELEPSWFEPVDVTSAEVSQVRIQLHPTATRDLRVVDQAGRPVAGSSVELIRIPGSDTAKVYTAVFRRPWLRGLWVGESALVLAEGSTDREGRFLLRSAPAKGLALRVTGQTHQTVVWNGIELQAGMPELVVEVKPGGEILGRLQPILPLAELDPTLHLLDVDDPSHRFPEGRGGDVPVSADGSFRFTNVPEGSWNLVFDAREMPDSVLMTVEGLGPGERRILSVSIAHLAPARLRGRVYVDGEPVQARVWFEMIGNGSGQRLTSYGRGSTADASGTFDLEAPEGRYRLLMESESSPGQWKSEEIIEVFASQETYQEFRFERRRFAAQLVDSDGTPLADRAVEVLWKESTWTASWLRSDATGHIIVDPAPPGSFHLGLRPPHLVTNDAWAMHRSEHGAKAYEDLIKIGPLQVSGAATVELSLPPIRE